MICLVAAEHSRDPYKQIFMLARFSLSLSLSLTYTHTQEVHTSLMIAKHWQHSKMPIKRGLAKVRHIQQWVVQSSKERKTNGKAPSILI